jgi:hypothetical protein
MILPPIWHEFVGLAYNITPQQINAPDSTTSIGGGITNAVALLMAIVGSLAVIFMIIGGIILAISAGDSKRVQQGRETILYSAVGIVVAISAYAITEFISGAVKGGH